MPAKPAVQLATALVAIGLLGVATGAAFDVNLDEIAGFSLPIRQVLLNPAPPTGQAGFWKWLLVASLMWGTVYYLFQRQHARCLGLTFSGLDLLRIFCPVLPLGLLAFVPPGIYTPILLIVGLGMATLRGAAAWPAETPSLRTDAAPGWHRLLPAMVILLSLCLAGVGFSYQKTGLNTLYLMCTDWTDYLTAVDNTLHGRWFICNNNNFLGSHFSPGSILLLCPYVWLFHSTAAFFLLNSLLLYCNVPLLYWLARTLQIPRPYAAALALCTLLSPSLINLNMTFIYGFHDIIMVMPLILLFFICQEKKLWWAAWLCFGVSLLIKETVPVFWAGLGLVFILWGRRRTGAALFACSCLYWLLVMKVFIPALSPRDVYDYASRFSHLGKTTWEIALSPILHPLIFMEYLLRPGCVYFVIMLILPVLFLVINRPMLLLGAGVTLVFVCVQISDQLQNIHMQYQAETVIMVFICASYSLQSILAGNPGWIFRYLCCWTGLRDIATAGARAVLTASLVTAAGSFWFFGENPWGKVPSTKFTHRPDFSPTIEALKKIIPADVPIQASLNLGGHFLLRNPVATDFGQPTQAPYVLMDLNSSISNIALMDRQRKSLLAAGYRVIFSQARGANHIVLLARDAAAPAIRDPLLAMTDAEWATFGSPVPDVFPPEFQVRAKLQAEPSPLLDIRVRLIRKVAHDCNIIITQKHADGTTSSDTCAFGNGVSPAFNASPGQVYAIGVPFADRPALNIEIRPRPNVD